jgi:hypothetical protein
MILIASKTLKFTDDAQLFGVVTNQQDIGLQNDLKNSCNWSANWLFMLINVRPCISGITKSRRRHDVNGKDGGN